MIDRLLTIGRPAACAMAGFCAGTAGAAEFSPHRALYTMTLGRSPGAASVVGANGTMAYQWGETCGGWTVEQRYRLKMGYSETPDVSIASNFVTWEAKDGLSYRFNQKETRNGTEDEEIRGTAKLDGPGKGGRALHHPDRGGRTLQDSRRPLPSLRRAPQAPRAARLIAAAAA